MTPQMTPQEIRQSFRDCAIRFSHEAASTCPKIIGVSHTLKENRRHVSMSPSDVREAIDALAKEMTALNEAFNQLCWAASAVTVTPGQAVALVRSVAEEHAQ